MVKNVLKALGVTLAACVLAVGIMFFAAFLVAILGEVFKVLSNFQNEYTISLVAAFIYTLIIQFAKKPLTRKLGFGKIPYLIFATLVPAIILFVMYIVIHFTDSYASVFGNSFGALFSFVLALYELAFSAAATILIELFLFLKKKLKKA